MPKPTAAWAPEPNQLFLFTCHFKAPKDVHFLRWKEYTLPSLSKIVSLGLNEIITWPAEAQKYGLVVHRHVL